MGRLLIKVISILLLTLATQSCGFHLQGHAPISSYNQNLPPLNVVVRDKDPRVAYAIEQQTYRRNYPQSALGIRVLVHTITFSSRDISLTTRKEATEKELIAHLRYEYPEHIQTISGSRVYTYDPNAVLSSEQQQAEIEQALIDELSARMFDQLATALKQRSHETQ